MAPRPIISNRPLPQVRGTPMNPGALTTQLNVEGTAVATSTETQAMPQPGQHAQAQRALPTSNGSRPSTPPSSANNTAATDVATQMRSIIESLERQPPTAENRAQAAAMARNLAELRERMDAAVSGAQPRLSADAPEFTPSPSQERGRQGAPYVGNEHDTAGGGNPLNQGGVILPTFTFTSESPGEPQQYTQEEARTQIAAIFGGSSQSSASQLPVVNGSAMASFQGHMAPITINPVTGRPRTPLSHLNAISNNARRRSQERAEREAAVQAQVDQITQQDQTQAQQMQQAQQLQAQQLQQAQQAQQAQAQQAQTQQLQQAQQAQQAQAQQAQAQQLQQAQAQQAQQLQQAQAQALQAYQARQAYQGQQPPQPLQVQQPQQPHQPHLFQGQGQGQQPSNGQIFNQIQQNLFAPQQHQQQYLFGVNDMSYGPSNHSHMHPQQQMGNDFAFNNMQDFSQGPPVPPFIPQNYDNPGIGQFPTQPATNQHQNMPFNNVNPLPAQPETQNATSSTHARDAPIPIGPNNVTGDPSMTARFRDTPLRTHSNPATDGASEDVAGYFPSAYELTGKWNTLPASMRTPPQIQWQLSGRDYTRNGDGPHNGGAGPSNGDGSGNVGGVGSMPLPTARGNSDQNGKTHSRGPSQGNSASHNNSNTRPQSASHTWRSHTHTISGDYTTLRRNAGHLDLLGSPAFPVSASEYAGVKADTLAEKQARLIAQLKEMTRAKGEEQRVGEAMKGRAFYGLSSVLGQKEDVWSVDGGSGAGFPSVAEMKKEHALVASETGSLSGSPGRFFPKPKGMVASIKQGYMGVSEPDLASTTMPREDWSVKSVEKAKVWENELAWGEIVAKASKEAALKVNQIPKNDSVLLVGRGLLDRLV
ncbi:hypothetical protein VE03_09941 [Pseudogymnoascus sp. 23342-1-I1]|nr:hypothetical protein VE03_09941 [Pseudogymnoascus sp. 23342-1-I1]